MKSISAVLVFVLAIAGSLSVSAAAPGAGEPKKTDWLKGPATANLKQLAQIEVPAGFSFTGGDGARQLLQLMGNPTNGRELGFLGPTNLDWFVIFEFSDTGYIKDDDKDKLDAAAMLTAITRGNEQANKERAKMGSAPLNVTGWQQPPKYNSETHNLEWAIRGESEGRAIVNYNTRILGRKGVMEVTLVVDPEQLTETLPTFQSLLTQYSFKAGERYAEYRSGDKLAKYGLTALILGGAAAGAAKLGLFGTIALFFKKAAKLVILLVVAVAAFARKVFSAIFNRGSAATDS